MSNTVNPLIFFHVGLGKTASTYLQYKVFPKFKNIEFIHKKPKYIKAHKIIAEGKFERYLISREFDQQLETEVKNFAQFYPNTTAIIVLRQHDSWIASQYRRFVKNGITQKFTEFFDLKTDKGKFSISDLEYYKKIQILEKYFTPKPVVLFYDDLKKDPFGFIDYIANLCGASYEKSEISLETKHSSYSEKQLKAIQKVSRKIDIEKRGLKNQILYQIRRFFINIIRYSTLFIAKYLPDNFFSDTELISKDELKAVKDYYMSDWQACIEYAEINNPKF